MKVFIQDSRTMEFYAGRGRWVTLRADARSWETGLNAQEHALRENLYSVHILLTFNQERETITVPFNTITLFADPSTFTQSRFGNRSIPQTDLHAQAKDTFLNLN